MCGLGDDPPPERLEEGEITEEEEWQRLTPAQRLVESGRLWAFYLAMGGSLDPEPDPQSPFYFPEAPGPGAADRRPGGP